MARGAPVFTVAVVGDTLQAVDGALQALVPCALPYGLDPALQPQGWLSGRCRVVREPASGTLWVGVAAAAEPGGGAAAADAPSHEAFKERENEAARALLAAFLTSHTVLWLASSGRGQVLPRVSDLLQRLRLLQQLKGALLPALPALLGVAPSEAGPAVPGFCIPQLFVLAQPPAAASARGSASTALAAEVAAAAPSAALPTEAARAAAERQLRLLLKRCRVLLPEDNARALCALPSAAPAVLCLPERLGSGSQEHLVADALAELALPGPAGPAVQQAQQGKPSAAAVVAAALAPQHAAVAATGGAQTWHTTLTSLAATLEAAALKAAGTPSEQPAADVAVPSEAAAAAAWQLACSDSVRQFSLASCKRAAAVASDAYRRNTPDLLPAGGHAVAAAAALRLYRSLARGPAAADGAAALRQQLDDYWRAGHQQCEAVSLLGNPCCLPVHDPQQQPHTSIADAAKPLLLLATGSGGQQQRIPEPFTVAELQQAAAAVAAESASAAARVQLWVRRLGGAAALSAALLMDGQPGWLRAGGCMFAQLPLLVAVPGKPGQQPAPTEQQEAQAPAAEEFPSLAEVKQHEQRRRRPPATAKQQRKEQELL
ncbi:SMG8 isoform X3 [Chlorella sorokiniana]|uniref:Nonsense-mediated mRNA decay factor SMG8 n=1 Tax=Chlorella sorokiniana TaxID=3076 RepID=A0A2P6U1N8_CHLSO|nr:SMG8 isoform X3 [Chlorella sorokiniana]|eukprot:PRW60224.1 SMG8 isoform X3 [Chlorella sorokiniana]